jgi:hypothetical protein
MGIGMTRVQHVKIPVSDLGCSAGWYATLLDQVPFREFVAHGALPGAALRSQKPQLSSHSGNGSSPPASPA